MNFSENKKLKNDIILISLILAAAAIFWLFTSFTKTEGAFAVVTVNGTEKARYSLNEDAEITIENGNGGYNILVIKDGKADITEASCSDNTCVNQRAISKTGETITCLPNKTVIKIVGAGKEEVDF